MLLKKRIGVLPEEAAAETIKTTLVNDANDCNIIDNDQPQNQSRLEDDDNEAWGTGRIEPIESTPSDISIPELNPYVGSNEEEVVDTKQNETLQPCGDVASEASDKTTQPMAKSMEIESDSNQASTACERNEQVANDLRNTKEWSFPEG